MTLASRPESTGGQRKGSARSSKRQLEAEEEVDLICGAARRVLRRTGYAEANITDILTEANLSTRAFYRHFSSKDEVLLSIYRRDSAQNARRIVADVQAIKSPVQAMATWVERMLEIGYDAQKRNWTHILDSSAARRAEGFETEEARAIDDVVEPLADIIRLGVESGAFVTRTPEEDARTIHRLTWGLIRDVVRGRTRMTYLQARLHVLRFSLAGLGAMEGPDGLVGR